MDSHGSNARGKPPLYPGPGAGYLHHAHNSHLDSERQLFMRNLHNQTLNQPINRRSSTGLLIAPYSRNSKPISNNPRFRRLHCLHYESLGVGLNDLAPNCVQNVYTHNLNNGLLLRASLPATPISTPIHREFQPFTEQLLLDRLCRTPSPARRGMHWDVNNNLDSRFDGRFHSANSSHHKNSSTSSNSSSLNQSLTKLDLKDDQSLMKQSSQFDPDDLSESDIETGKGLRLMLNLNRKVHPK